MSDAAVSDLRKKIKVVFLLQSKMLELVADFKQKLEATTAQDTGGRKFKIVWPRVPTIYAATGAVHAGWRTNGHALDYPKTPSLRSMRRYYRQWTTKGSFSVARPGRNSGETWCVCVCTRLVSIDELNPNRVYKAQQ